MACFSWVKPFTSFLSAGSPGIEGHCFWRLMSTVSGTFCAPLVALSAAVEPLGRHSIAVAQTTVMNPTIVLILVFFFMMLLLFSFFSFRHGDKSPLSLSNKISTHVLNKKLIWGDAWYGWAGMQGRCRVVFKVISDGYSDALNGGAGGAAGR